MLATEPRRARLQDRAFEIFRIRFARHVQTALRNFPWPIKKRILAAPPLPAIQGSCSVIVMTTQRDWLDALWSAYSWHYFARALSSPTIVVDGEITEEMRVEARQIMPGATVSAAAYLPACEDAFPQRRSFFRDFKYGRKAAVIFTASTSGPMIFSDSDVLLFREPNEILSHIGEQPGVPLCNVELGGHAWNAPALVDLMLQEGIAPIPGFNSGLMYVPAGKLDVDLFARRLQAQAAGSEHFFTEQSIFNALLSKHNARPLDPATYSVSLKGAYFYERDVDYGELAARHFTGMVRHKMYTAGMPLLARRIGF